MTKLKIKITPENCIACGLCQAYAPDIFDYFDDGIVKFLRSDQLSQEVADSEQVRSAIKKCPTGALKSISDS